MGHEWHAGVLNQSSWHGLESVEKIPDAETMIRRGYETGAWPVEVGLEGMTTASGLQVPGKAVVATYQDGKRVAHSARGTQYTPLDPKEWAASVEAIVRAGGRPAGAFALRGGARILATFEVPSADGQGIRNMLNMVDSMDGSSAHLVGGSSVRVVCANTLAAWMGRDGKQAAKLMHFGSINDRVNVLREAIEAHITRGKAVVETYAEAKERRLTKLDAESLLEKLFPLPTEEQRKSQAIKSNRLERERRDALLAMQRPENNEGPTVATVWNAATWLLDRDPEGNAKPTRGGDDLNSLLFGTRARRNDEIRHVIEVVMNDGSIEEMEKHEAARHGIDYAKQGAAFIDEILG